MDNSHLDHTALPPGTRLYYGKYVISSKIGQGGFGITYKAVQQGLNRAVCIKEYYIEGRCARDFHSHSVRPQNISEEVYEKYRQSFVKESQTLASLHYTGIVEVIDIFDENNTSYMVMPFIEGRTLQDIVDSNGPLKYPEAVNYMAQVANAVGYIHEHHILHRDIKPGNIMITADYKAVIIDFGSAREYVEDKTQSHTSMLTHGYAPPEQYSRTSRKGSYTDIYALGATLYFILTGRVPVEAAARLTEDMPEPRQLNPNIPAEANRTIMKAMQLEPQDRHQSIREFMADLSNVRGSKSLISGEGNSKGLNAKKRKRIFIILILIVLAIGALILLKPNKGSMSDDRGESGDPTTITGIGEETSTISSGVPMGNGDAGEIISGNNKNGPADNDEWTTGLAEIKVKDVINKLNDAYTSKDYASIATLFADNVEFFGKHRSNSEIVEISKKQLRERDNNQFEVKWNTLKIEQLSQDEISVVYEMNYIFGDKKKNKKRFFEIEKHLILDSDYRIKYTKDTKTKEIQENSTEISIKEETHSDSYTEQSVFCTNESKQGFDVIAGFYINRNTANKMASRLKSQGFDAYIIEKNDAYYVSMGSAPTRTKAEALYNHIKSWYDGDISIKQW